MGGWGSQGTTNSHLFGTRRLEVFQHQIARLLAQASASARHDFVNVALGLHSGVNPVNLQVCYRPLQRTGEMRGRVCGA